MCITRPFRVRFQNVSFCRRLKTQCFSRRYCVLFVCLFVCLFICLPLCLCLSVSPPLSVSLPLSLCLSPPLSVSLPLSLCLSPSLILSNTTESEISSVFKVCLWCNRLLDQSLMVDPLSYHLFQSVVHNWCNFLICFYSFELFCSILEKENCV